MMAKECYECVDFTFRDIMKHEHAENADLPFGGKVMVFGGDFRQVLPIVPKGSRAQCVDACLNRSYLWQHMQHMRLVKNMRVHRLQGMHAMHLHHVHWLLPLHDYDWTCTACDTQYRHVCMTNQLPCSLIMPLCCRNVAIPQSHDTACCVQE